VGESKLGLVGDNRLKHGHGSRQIARILELFGGCIAVFAW
jgi:hypothetical protein